MRKKPTFSEYCKKKFGLSIKAYLKQSAKDGKKLTQIAKDLGCSYSHAHYLADENEVIFLHANKKRRKK